MVLRMQEEESDMGKPAVDKPKRDIRRSDMALSFVRVPDVPMPRHDQPVDQAEQALALFKWVGTAKGSWLGG